MLRTAPPGQAAAVLARAGATVADRRPGPLTVSGLPAERIVALLADNRCRSRRCRRTGRPWRRPTWSSPATRSSTAPSPAGLAGRDDRHDHDHAVPARHAPAGRDSFAHLLHAEWTKFRTVRGWVIAVIVAVLVTVLLGLFTAGLAAT